MFKEVVLKENISIWPWSRVIYSHVGGTSGKESACQAGDLRDTSSIPGSGRFPGEGHGNPLQYSCLENPMDRHSLAGYSPLGRKESDTIEGT